MTPYLIQDIFSIIFGFFFSIIELHANDTIRQHILMWLQSNKWGKKYFRLMFHYLNRSICFFQFSCKFAGIFFSQLIRLICYFFFFGCFHIRQQKQKQKLKSPKLDPLCYKDFTQNQCLSIVFICFLSNHHVSTMKQKKVWWIKEKYAKLL